MRKEKPTPPTPLTFEAVVRKACERALLHDAHVPILLIEGNQRRIVTPLPQGATAQERQQQMAHLGLALALENHVGQQLKQVYLISEAWVSRADVPQPVISPAPDPQGLEVLLISRTNGADDDHQVAAFAMHRLAEGRLYALQPLVPPGETPLVVDSPLLTAFVEGFALGTGL